MRRGILGIVGSRVADVERVVCRRRPIEIAPRIDRFRRRVVGRTVTDVGLVGNGIREFLYWDRRGLGNVRLFSRQEFQEAFGPDKVGPDGLTVTGKVLR